MPDLMSIQPIAAIIGAIISAGIAAIVTYFVVVKRKGVTFIVSTWTRLNRAVIRIKNSGNDVISGFEFDVMIPGVHPLRLADRLSKDIKLHDDVKIRFDEEREIENPRFYFSLPFFNPRESFDAVIFFDGSTVDCEIGFRMQGVACKVRRFDYLVEVLGVTAAILKEMPVTGKITLPIFKTIGRMRSDNDVCCSCIRADSAHSRASG